MTIGATATQKPAWTWRVPVLILSAMFGGLIGIAAVGVFLVQPVFGEAAGEALMTFPVLGHLAMHGTAILLVYLLVARRTGWRTIGFTAAPVRTWFLVPLGAVVLLVGTTAIAALYPVLTGEPFANPQATRFFGEEFGVFLIASLVIVLVGVVPLSEELVFRGIIYPLLDHRWGASVAIGSSAVLFAAYHISTPVLFPVFLFVGIVLGWLRAQSASLWPCIVLHAAYNGIGLGLMALAATQS